MDEDQTHQAGVLNDGARELLDGKNFAIVATLNPDGSPQTSVVWVDRDGDTMVFSTTAGRLKARNLSRDSRVSATIFAADNPYRYLEIRGNATLVKDEGRVFMHHISQKYRGGPPPPEADDIVRLVVRVTATKIVEFAV